MSEEQGIKARFQQFRPSKTLWFWSSAGAIIVVLVLGFTVGGWVTGGTAREMAQASQEEGRAELAAAICVEKFIDNPQFTANLAALKEEDSWSRDNFITDGGWVTLAGTEEPVKGAADLCAESLVEMKASAADGQADLTKS